MRVQQWRKNQRIIRTTAGRDAVLTNFWRASSPSTLQRVLEICLSVLRTATAIPFEIENSQLQGPSLIVDAPMKLQTGVTSLSFLSLRYLEEEAESRGLKYETSDSL